MFVCAAVHVCAKLVSAMTPVLAGRVAVTEPSAPVVGDSVTVPEVAFPKAMVPSVPLAPRVGVAVNAGLAPANTCPAAPVIETAPAAETATGAVPVIAPPPLLVTQVVQFMLPVDVVIASGELAVTAGVPLDVPAIQVGVPAVACGWMASVPEVEPRSWIVPRLPELAPRMICGAAPVFV